MCILIILESEQQVHSGEMISFGTYHLIVTIKPKADETKEDSIAILLADGEETKEAQYFF